MTTRKVIPEIASYPAVDGAVMIRRRGPWKRVPVVRQGGAVSSGGHQRSDDCADEVLVARGSETLLTSVRTIRAASSARLCIARAANSPSSPAESAERSIAYRINDCTCSSVRARLVST